MKKYLVGDIEIGGFGAMYARRKLIMQIAEAFNRVPVFRFTAGYAYEDPFESLPTVLNDLKKLNVNEVKKFNFQNTDDMVLYFDFDWYWHSIFREKYQCWHPKDQNYLFYSGKLYDSLKIKSEYKNKINQQIKKICDFWKIDNFKDVVGLHLRRGKDKKVETDYVTDEAFIDLITQQKLATKIIFITSDDKQSIRNIINNNSKLTFIYDKDELRHKNTEITNLQQVYNNPELKTTETLTFIKNVEILKQCFCVIGSYNVQLTKISGSINSYLNNKNNLFLINPQNNALEIMGSSFITS